MSFPSFSDEPAYVVGCWESKLAKPKNVFTICINYEFGSLTSHYSNEGSDSKPTKCFQPAFVTYEDGFAILEGWGGRCKNGNEQPEVTIKCQPTMDEVMACEYFFAYIKMEGKRIKRVE